ncbi:MAG: CAAX protease [Leptolyngbyaceae cyanobacterium SM1_1_3]|nr:CAAX protease [Leptolyngbyaceae cyanobacterium SM1_1_3]
MTETAIAQFWILVKGVLALDPAMFQLIQQFPQRTWAAAAVVLLAGLSLAVAESVVLFLNRVRPARFVFSLLLGAILFACGYGFWVLATWLSSVWLLRLNLSLETIALVLAFSYAPLMFSFVGALPYYGVPLLRLLSVWTLLAMMLGFSAVADLPLPQAFEAVVTGWIALQLLQQTIGQPVAALGRWLANAAAGVKLVTDRRSLADLIRVGGAFLADAALPNRLLPTAANSSPLVADVEFSPAHSDWVVATPPEVNSRPTEPVRRLSGLRFPLRRSLQYIGLTLFAGVITFVLSPVRRFLIGTYDAAGDAWIQFFIDLAWISLIIFIISGLLAPLEALGWWAGWYGDPIAATRPVISPLSVPRDRVKRYLIYLDGTGQSTKDYQPLVANFLNHLAQQLPEDMLLVKGLMSYSVLDRPLTEDRPLPFWRWVEGLEAQPQESWVGALVSFRNMLMVSVSADQRYGPVYNWGIAQRIYDSLMRLGYPAEGNVPITLVGYSGGAQVGMGVVPFLKSSLNTSVEVISLGGVISGRVDALEVEQLYHLVGDRDWIERLGIVLFPRRWRVSFLSYWHRAKRKGKISLIALKGMGHQGDGGMLDPALPAGESRSHLQRTLTLVMNILQDKFSEQLVADQLPPETESNYQRYSEADFNHWSYYPLEQTVDAQLYQPIASWMGRLILPKSDQRRQVNGALFEVHHAPAPHASLVGKVVRLRWSQEPAVQARVRQVIQDIHFSAEADYTQHQGLIHPVRLNHWRQVNPLESLAGSRPENDVIVALPEGVEVAWESGAAAEQQVAAEPTGAGRDWVLYVEHEPAQISGRYYGLVQFLGPDAKSDRYCVTHFNRVSRRFDGPTETVRLPQVITDTNGTLPATANQIEQSPQNQEGWYIYGAPDADGLFVVQAIAPRELFRLMPNRTLLRAKAGLRYVKQKSWKNLAAKKGQSESVLISPHTLTAQQARQGWQVGDRALLIHIYGGIGGNQREPAAKAPIYFGHFAYGVATVVHEPLADEPQFDIRYYQVYTHNNHGIVAGVLHWTRYMGDRQWGFLGTRPVADILIKHPAYTQPFDFNGALPTALDDLIRQLEIMVARYRIGDGTGGTYVGPANNCAQDSNQALYASIKQLEELMQTSPPQHPEQAQRYQQLLEIRKALQRELLPLGSARADWEEGREVLGSNLEDYPLKTLGRGLLSWRTMFPRVASDTVTELFLRHGACLWVLRTNQVGGYDPEIEAIAPFTF